jgi:hypothetical protein
VSLRRRLGWIVLGGVLVLGADALACLAAFFDWERSWTTASAVIRYSYVVGMPGVDLSGHGWVYTRYLYALIVSLPYVMGWAAHLAALVGLVVLVRSAPQAAGIVLAFVVPFYAIMGGATAVVPRYYLPLGPYLAIAAGAALDRGLEGRRRWLGVAAVVLVLGYTGALTLSQCRRLGLGPQRAVAALVADEAHRTPPPLAVAYPHILVLYYDAVRPLVEPIPGVKMVYYPAEYQNIRHETGDTPPEAERLARERRWVEEKDVRVVILPSWVENGVRRERPDGATAGFYRHLADGSLGFHLAGDFRTRYWTEGLYTWAEPMLDTHWETALVGYRVFVRSAESR